MFYWRIYASLGLSELTQGVRICRIMTANYSLRQTRANIKHQGPLLDLMTQMPQTTTQFRVKQNKMMHVMLNRYFMPIWVYISVARAKQKHNAAFKYGYIYHSHWECHTKCHEQTPKCGEGYTTRNLPGETVWTVATITVSMITISGDGS